MQYWHDCTSLVGLTERQIVAVDQFSVAGGAIVSESSSIDALILDAVEADGARDTVNVAVRVRISANNQTMYVLVARGSDANSASTSNGYLVAIRNSAIRLYSRVNGAISELQGVTKSHLLNTDYWVELDCAGTTIRARSWLATDPRPSTWDCDRTDAAVSGVGYAGTYSGAGGSTVTRTGLGVGTGGDQAPLSAVGGGRRRHPYRQRRRQHDPARQFHRRQAGRSSVRRCRRR